mmetsp:Transcript_2180/g.6659  ORF Transcript_2180/g.6659 Transcript_2180/m.6659 type:complete len:373 (+) Transcript_2180:2361-3479(+)
MIERSEQRSAENNRVRIVHQRDRSFFDQAIQPRRIDSVLFKGLRFQKLDEVFNCRANFTPNHHTFQRQDQRFSRFFSRFTRGKDMTKLRIREFVHASVSTDGKVTPNRRGRLEVHSFDAAGSRLETFVWIFSRNSRRNHMVFNRLILFVHEVNGIRAFNISSIESSHVWHSVKRDTHGDLQLRRGHVDAGDTFRHRVFNLQTRVQFQKEVFVRRSIIKIFNRTGTDVTDVLRQSLRGFFHLAENIRLGDDWRTFFENLLETSLRGAVTAVKRHSVAMFITYNLYFQMSRFRAQLHHKHWRTRNFRFHLVKVRNQLLLVGGHTDTFTATTFGCFQHDRKSNSIRRGDALFDRRYHGFIECFFRNRTFWRQVGD